MNWKYQFTGMQFLIEKIRQIIQVSESEEQILQDLFVEKQLSKGDHFLVENQVCRWLGLIHHGLVRYYINMDGEDKTYYFGKEGDFVCDYESFLPQKPSNKNIQVLKTVLFISLVTRACSISMII